MRFRAVWSYCTHFDPLSRQCAWDGFVSCPMVAEKLIRGFLQSGIMAVRLQSAVRCSSKSRRSWRSKHSSGRGMVWREFGSRTFQDQNRGFLPHGAVGARNGSGLNRVSLAAALVLRLLYPRLPEKHLTIQERNNLIRAGYAAGETLECLAQTFHISKARVHQIVHRRNH